MRAAIYARYSSDEQTGGESIDYQLEQCREYITNQGWSLDDANIFVDEARSGTSTFRREAFNQMVGFALADSGRAKEVDRQMRKVEQEMKNLTAAIKAGGPIEAFVTEYKECEARKAELKAERKELKGAGKAQLEKMGRRKIKTAIRDLKETLGYATPEEQKILLREHIREIRIPKNGAALLEANPEGLLDALGCFKR